VDALGQLSCKLRCQLDKEDRRKQNSTVSTKTAPHRCSNYNAFDQITKLAQKIQWRQMIKASTRVRHGCHSLLVDSCPRQRLCECNFDLKVKGKHAFLVPEPINAEDGVYSTVKYRTWLCLNPGMQYRYPNTIWLTDRQPYCIYSPCQIKVS
jgi:hypothetical protein